MDNEWFGGPLHRQSSQRVQTLPKIGAPLHFRRFDSGVLVVQSDSHSDDKACAHTLYSASVDDAVAYVGSDRPV